MKYFNLGTRKKKTRVQRIQSLSTKGNEALIAYLREHDFLMDFLTDPDYERKGNPTYLEEISYGRGKCETERTFICGKEYAIVTDIYGTMTCYEILPDIYNDNQFKWVEDKGTGTMSATLVFGVFEFECVKLADGNGTISVRYAKCETKHRNKVTLELIEIPEITDNQTYLDAIQQWKNGMEKDMSEIA